METTEFKTENIELLRSLRIQEKAIKADIARVKPLAEDEAKLIQPDGGKFTIDGVGDFVLDKDPILNIEKSTSEEAIEYRKKEKERDGYRRLASELTTKMSGLLKAFKKKYAKKAKEFTFNLKCVGLD